MNLEDKYNKIYRYCYYRVRNKDVAEDLTQETFLRFFESNYQEKGREMNYLYTIAKNLCINEIKNNVLTLQNEEIADESVFDEDLVEKIHIRNLLMELPDDDREVLILRYMNGETVSDISKLLGISRFALYRKIQNAKKELKNKLEGGKSNE
jgi:RNA polymerase sigma factor, sigma-70 family